GAAGKSDTAKTNCSGPGFVTWKPYISASPVSTPAVPSTTCVRKVAPREATGSTFERRTRPNPCSLLGHVSEAERETVPDPVTGTPEAIKRARIRAALGVIASAASGRPDGYQPSVKYCRRIAAAAAAAGVE